MSERDAPEAESSTEDLEDLYENAPCGYLSLRPNGRIAKANATLARWTGHAPGQLVGMRFHDLLNIAGRILMETQLAPLLRMQGFFDEVALDLVSAAGGKLPVIANAVERRDASGAVLFTRVTVFKAADRRTYERNLVEAKRAAERERDAIQALEAMSQENLRLERETSELREQFIAVLGHDLRNPVAAIDSGTKLLLRQPQDDKSRRVIGMMQGSVVRMRGLIDNVLDFARARLGDGVDPSPDAEKPLRPVLEQVVLELMAIDPGRRIEAQFDLGRPVAVDHARIAQMFSNLLGNALIHGASDKPIRVGASTDNGAFSLWVANAGVPIPPETLDRLFQPFFRGNARPSQQGLGLGLYIASEIARAHGGTLTAMSDEDETQFTFQMRSPTLIR